MAHSLPAAGVWVKIIVDNLGVDSSSYWLDFNPIEELFSKVKNKMV